MRPAAYSPVFPSGRSPILSFARSSIRRLACRPVRQLARSPSCPPPLASSPACLATVCPLPASPTTSSPVCQLARSPDCSSARLPAHLPASLLACPPARFSARSLARPFARLPARSSARSLALLPVHLSVSLVGPLACTPVRSSSGSLVGTLTCAPFRPSADPLVGPSVSPPVCQSSSARSPVRPFTRPPCHTRHPHRHPYPSRAAARLQPDRPHRGAALFGAATRPLTPLPCHPSTGTACKPGPRNGGGGPQTISFVERVCKRESCLIILLKDERRYTRITLGFRSQGVEQFVRG